jgi:hypothetical protein
LTRQNVVTKAIGLASQILCHPQLRAVIDPLEFDFVHQRLN